MRDRDCLSIDRRGEVLYLTGMVGGTGRRGIWDRGHRCTIYT
jgi:hypothetical protein